ncbi:MAG: hypothetical protein IJB05_04785 [Bacteroidales bacterium]|nr:hypothetical protein [Bacteroidales bacterium]
MAKHHKNTLLRIKHVCEITQLHYEEGNLQKCYKEIWRKYVYPIYPMCYHTYLSYIRTPMSELRERDEEDDPMQLSLF